MSSQEKTGRFKVTEFWFLFVENTIKLGEFFLTLILEENLFSLHFKLN